jgi:hypothetical protein
MGKIGYAGVAILALIFFFIVKPWHNANDAKSVNCEEQSIFTTWWQLGQPTRPQDVTQDVRPTAAPSVTTSVVTKPAPTGKSVTTAAAPKAQGPKKAPITKANKSPQPQPQYVDMAQALHSAVTP